MTDRLFFITYEEDGDTYEAVIPEYLIPTIEDLVDISVIGRLIEGYRVVVDEEPDDPEKEPIPITGTNR